MSDSAEDYETGWESGYKSGVRETTRILRDLISELRGQADIWQEGDINEDRWDYPAMMLRAHSERAEARLKGLNDV